VKTKPVTVAPATPVLDILTPQELAAALKVKPGWVYEMMRPRRINTQPFPVFRAGKYLRFSLAAVLAWMANAPRPCYKPRRKRTHKAVTRG